MDVSIRAIVVWPKRRDRKCRQVQFKEGVINIITGTNGSGKSSLIHIVDYCLGSGKCSIPVGVIRDSVEWFGVLLQFRDFQLLLGRRNPEDKDQSGDAYIVEATSIDVTTCVPEKTATVEYLKSKLNELAGLPNVGFEPGNISGFKGPPSFRDLAAFGFQPQYIVANPNTLFFKADTYEHREKLRTIFPLVLGALTTEQLAAKHEIFQLQTELDRRQAVLDRKREAAAASAGQIRAYIIRAQELGLLPPTIAVASDMELDRLLDVLKMVPHRLAEGLMPSVDVGAAETVVREVRNLEDREDNAARDLSRVNRQLLQIERLRSSVANYATQLVTQEGRLVGVGWLSKRIAADDNCPLCGSASDEAHNALSQLIELANEMQQLSATTATASPTLEREIIRLREEARAIETELNTLRQQKWYLEDQSVELAEVRRTEVEAYRLAGRIEQILDVHQQASVDNSLTQEIDALRDRLAALRELANPAIERARLSGALQRFTQAASRYVETLKLERSGDPVELNVEDLMINIVDNRGRRDALWEVGSAENWMGYHIATLLGLHEDFLRMDWNPVPSFIMVDQPSQAYFPDRWPGDNPGPDGAIAELESDDIAGVRRIFETMSLAIKRTNGRLQIIVVDHAGEITWDGLPSINVIANWRIGKDDFLIPRDWIENGGPIDYKAAPSTQ